MLDIIQFNKKVSIQSRTSEEDDLYLHGRVGLSKLSAHEVAQSFTSSFPYFVRIMKSFNVSGSYTLVGCFLRFYFSLRFFQMNNIFQICYFFPQITSIIDNAPHCNQRLHLFWLKIFWERCFSFPCLVWVKIKVNGK